MDEFAWMSWTPLEVATWIESLLGPPFGSPFLEKHVDGPTLLELSEEDITYLGIDDSIQRKKVVGHIRVMRMRRARFELEAGIAGNPLESLTDAQTPGTRKSASPRKASPRGFDASPTRGRLVAGAPLASNRSASASHTRLRAEARNATSGGDCAGGMPAGTATPPMRIATQSNISIGSSHEETQRRPVRRMVSAPGSPPPQTSRSGSGYFAQTSTSRKKGYDFEPGPATYSPDKGKGGYPQGSRNVIGTARRNTSEFLILPSAEIIAQTPSAYYLGPTIPPTHTSRVKGGVIGTASRWQCVGTSPRNQFSEGNRSPRAGR